MNLKEAKEKFILECKGGRCKSISKDSKDSKNISKKEIQSIIKKITIEEDFDRKEYVLLNIDVEKLNKMWSADKDKTGLYLGKEKNDLGYKPGGKEYAEKYLRNKENKTIDATKLGFYITKNNTPVLSDGRHRFIVMRDVFKVKVLPMAVNKEQVSLAKKLRLIVTKKN